MERRISQCPACGNNDFEIAELRCKTCETTIRGHFLISKLATLSSENLHFVETFIRCRGNIKDVEKALSISYPTVRSRLDRVIELLGYESGNRKEQRKSILQSLENNEMTAEEALFALKDL